eukprot:TRINITY_DN33202_c0_g1_i1.p1 TRINITY_DN33202_c0_g1~~TRINITY_DN33202_c0_g1_i1.p1  ORF type:complete len:118 (-),score=1.18 TRINITY_DN33202_c0_g1_i1:731-1084(-)
MFPFRVLELRRISGPSAASICLSQCCHFRSHTASQGPLTPHAPRPWGTQKLACEPFLIARYLCRSDLRMRGKSASFCTLTGSESPFLHVGKQESSLSALSGPYFLPESDSPSSTSRG